jgi:hypothetical protein
MSKQTTEQPRYMVSVYPSRDEAGKLIFTFVPKGRRAEGEDGGPPQPVPHYIVHVREDPLTFDWRSPPPDQPEGTRQDFEEEVRTRISERKAWIGRVADLVGDVERWGKELGWSTRRIQRRLDDSRIGKHKVPALLMQEDAVRVYLEPVSRSVPGGDGLVELSLMPGYDDVASLYHLADSWYVHYVFPSPNSVAAVEEAETRPLSRDVLAQVLARMKENAE